MAEHTDQQHSTANQKRHQRQNNHGNARREEPLYIVDTLEAELVKIAVEEENKQRQSAEEDRIYRAKLTPALVYLSKHLLKLIGLLNHPQLKERLPNLCMPEIRYSMKYHGAVLEGHQTNYKLVFNKGGMLNGHRNREADFILSAQCVPENNAEFSLVDFRELGHLRTKCEMEQYLTEHYFNFKFVESECAKKMIKSLFTISPIIDIRFEFFGCPEKEAIQLVVKNFGGLGKNGLLGKEEFLPIKPEQIHEKSLEALIRYVIRKPSQLHSFWGLERSTQPSGPETPAPHFVPPEDPFKDVDVRKLLGNIQITQKSLKELKQSVDEQSNRRQQEHEQLMRELTENAKKNQAEHERFMREIDEFRKENLTYWERFWSFILQFMPFQPKNDKKFPCEILGITRSSYAVLLGVGGGIFHNRVH